MKPQFVNGQIYHIYNRGVEKRKTFINDIDYFRFIHDLYEFNDEAPALNIYYKLPKNQSYEVQLRKIERNPRKILVEILAFCLMPNHFHLLLRQKIEKGVIRFMQKLGTGYTNYFNKAYERVGSLFQGRYKAVLINQETHLLHVPYYIHANPIDIAEPNWQERKFNINNAVNFLKSYRWSSYLDYTGIKNFPSVINKNFLLEYYNNNIQEDMLRWLKQTNAEWGNIKEVILE